MRIQRITVTEVEYTAYQLAKKLMTWDEPIPDFSTRFPNMLESCLATPFQTYGKLLYRGLIEKAAILFYLMIKNHPFANGNKRIAVMTLLYFLHKNKKWLRASTKGLYTFAVQIAESAADQKDETVDAIQRFLKAYLVDLEKKFV